MLKTLEEPPEHMKFILATTDPQKIPVTVLSRCLQFNLKQMPPPAITSHLARILEQENVPFEAEALPIVARAAAGSMRDALSLLDQAIAHGGGKVAAQGVSEMLGAIDQSYLVRLLESIADGDAAGAVAIADEMQARSLSFDAALADLASLLLRMALAQSIPDALEEVVDRGRIEALAARLDAELVQLYYQIALQGREDLPRAPDEHAGFLMTVLRMLAFRPDSGSSEPEPAEAKAPASKASAQPKVAIPAAASTAAAAPALAAAKAPAAIQGWPELVQQLNVTGAARELARNAELQRQEEGMFDLVVPKAKAYLAERNYMEKLKAALDQHFGRPVRLNVSVGEVAGVTAASIEAGQREARRVEAVKSVQGDGFVQDLVNMFDGKVVDSSIRENGK
jgi:DNA polymerase-3 subunit gamma/tau